MQNKYTLHFIKLSFLKQKWPVLLLVALFSSFSGVAGTNATKSVNTAKTGKSLEEIFSISGQANTKTFLETNVWYKTIIRPASGATATGTKAFGFTGTLSDAYLVVENLDKFPAADHLTFSYIQIPWRRRNSDGSYTPYNANHNKVKLRLSNKGTGPLSVNSFTLSNPAAWKIVELNGAEYNANTAMPLIINAKGSVEILIEFIARNQNDRVKILHDQLTINSDDNLEPEKKVMLHGLWQRSGEGNSEPYAQEIISAFGFKTRTGYDHDDGAIDGKTLVPNSDEVLAPYFQRVDASKPVSVIQMAAYHGCCSETESFQWFRKDATTFSTLFRHNGLDAQSLLPRKYGSSTELARGTFNPTGAFGIKVRGSYSDTNKNYQKKIGMRIWKAVDANGNIIPNAYIIGTDYLNTQYTNYDYQDNLYYISNVKPEAGTANYSELAAAPSAVDFGSVLVGATKTLTVNLSNLGQTYPDGSTDPTIEISKVELTGPTTGNINSFAVSAPAVSTLAATAGTTVSVSFNPSTTGLKNAALLVYYNSASSPLRIPLYGIADQEAAPITLAKRIKGASNTDLTINGRVWEADMNYRKGSIKMDKQVVLTPVASTDDDELYQTYLSAAANLAETRYEVPLANGEYGVRMHFVENYFSNTAARVFGVTIEDELRLANFDIFREVGYRAALVKDFNVDIKDGVLNIKFNPTADRVALAGVEIFSLPAGTVTAIEPDINLPGNEKEITFKIYPNPNPGQKVFVQVNNFAIKEDITLTVHDPLGRLIQTDALKTDENGAGTKEILLLPHIQSGVYIIRAATTSGVKSARLIIR